MGAFRRPGSLKLKDMTVSVSSLSAFLFHLQTLQSFSSTLLRALSEPQYLHPLQRNARESVSSHVCHLRLEFQITFMDSLVSI